jgi:hypothetical protein
MFHMLTKQDRSYIDNLLDKRFDDFEVRFESKMDAKFESLAIMIQRGFSECVTKTEFRDFKSDMDERFNSVDERFTSVDNHLDNLEGKMNTLEFKLITAPNNRLDKVEDDIRQIKSKVGLI